MRGLFVGLLLSLLGCVAQAPVPWASLELTDDFSAEERDAVADAVEMWNAVALRQVVLDGSHASAVYVVRKVDPGEGRGGFVSTRERVFHVAPWLDLETFRVVVAHELGHVLRLEHIDGEGIMNAEAVAGVEMSEGDLEECRRVRACEG